LKLLDATHIIADGAIPTTIQLVREGRRRLVEALEEEHDQTDTSFARYRPAPDTPRNPTQEVSAHEFRVSQELLGAVKGERSARVERMVKLREKVVVPETQCTFVSFVDPQGAVWN
jgi:hypothetical protein